jgi:hypothetical protein
MDAKWQLRHESIDTTMGYDVDLDADELAEDPYGQENAANGPAGAVLGTVGQSGPIPMIEPNDANPYDAMDLRKHARQDSNLQPAD